MRARTRSRGEGKLGCLFWLALLVIFGMICWEAVPIKIASAELHQYMKDQAKTTGSSPAERIKRRILARAKDLDLPVTKENLSVRKTANRIFMEVSYTVPLEFPFYTFNWSFSHKVDLPYFIV